jgi:uncharacterized protein involved in type VI secretion and phage assembly
MRPICVARPGVMHRDVDVTIGVVTDNRDPRGLGRVKVRLPLGAEHDATAWAPVVMPGAGPRCGWFLLPDVEDEVVVAFEHGDIDRPIVIGALWNGRDRPPELGASDAGKQVALVSRSGHRLVLDDANRRVVLEDGGGHGRVVLDADRATVTLEALDGDVVVYAPEGRVVVGAAAIEVSAGRDVVVRADGAVAMTAGRTLTIDAKAVHVAGLPASLVSGAAKPAASVDVQVAEISDPYR